MKRLITLVLICCSTAIIAQDYKLFDSKSQKLFTTFPEKSSTYSLSFDSVVSFGSDSIYYNFYRIGEMNFVSYDCDFWGDPNCYKQNIAVWPGEKISFDNQYNYGFFPGNGNTIQLDFTPNGDTNIFYEDSTQKFSLSYEFSDTITVLNFPDSARFYTIHHTDLDGNTINSELNNQKIIIGKDLGLVRFFQINEFPEVLNPITLIGQKKQGLGIFNITLGMLYDFEVGDEFQYKEVHFNTLPYYEDENYTAYRKHNIIEKDETNDSLIYTIDETIFYEDSSLVINQTIQKVYQKNQVFAQLPFEKFNGDYQWFFMDDYCGLKSWTYRFEAENALVYCEIDNVWGYYDTFGPPSEEETTWAFGLGMFKNNFYDYYNGIQYASGYNHTLIYFKKGDLECGNIVVSTAESNLSQKLYQVYPNPVNDQLFIKSPQTSQAYQIEIRNGFGQLIQTESQIEAQHHVLNVASLAPGMYYYKITVNGKVVQQGKMIKV
ncbi:MAG: T9SS type A sorting domain-containing protein [Bacteroidales bacterium]|jgi:hypothetical protein|nr:T9SS type A sorting domain-containing protein [Bacteroidales bacterium]MDN5349914.1 Secretion system C-terminal sorting domain [Bacteroidales bacterium]